MHHLELVSRQKVLDLSMCDTQSYMHADQIVSRVREGGVFPEVIDFEGALYAAPFAMQLVALMDDLAREVGVDPPTLAGLDPNEIRKLRRS